MYTIYGSNRINQNSKKSDELTHMWKSALARAESKQKSEERRLLVSRSNKRRRATQIISNETSLYPAAGCDVFKKHKQNVY